MRERRVKAYRRGLFAETVSALLLRLKGYAIVARRYKTPVGEIDLVALKGKRLAFIEVKRRKTQEDAAWTLPARQRRRIIRGRAILALRAPRLRGPRHRFRRGAGGAMGLAALYRERLFRAIRARHGPQSRLPDGPDRAHRYQGRFHLRACCSKRNGAGTTCSTTRPNNLSLRDGKLIAEGHSLTVEDKPGAHYRLAHPRAVDLAEYDVVQLRQDPPFDMAYITTTHLLERLQPRTVVVNDPAAVRNAPEKVFVLDFLDLMPPTLITRSPEQIRAFRAKHKDIVVKPLYGNGGAAIFRIKPGDTNLNSLIELMGISFREPIMVQRYLPEVREGDKRIILVDGEIAGAINRVPAPDETRSNLHVGGTAQPTTLTKRDKEICARLGPELKKRGLIFTGIDVIGDRLTEINVTSPTGIRQIAQFGGADVAAMIWDVVEKKVKAERRKERAR